MKIKFYSALFGDYDDIFPVEQSLKNRYDFILYTDNKDLKINGFKIKYISRPNINSSLSNRMIKFNPSKYVTNCDYAVYFDANIGIKAGFVEFLENNINQLGDLNLFRHPINSNVHEEIILLKKLGRIANHNYIKARQFIDDNNKKYNLDFLSENNIFVTKPKSKKIKLLFQDCIKNLVSIIGRDQIILPVLIRKHKVQFKLFPSLRVSENSLYFKWRSHKFDLNQNIYTRTQGLLNNYIFIDKYYLNSEDKENHLDSKINEIQDSKNCSKLLAIVMPTFNRPEIFEENIKSYITYCSKYKIKIYISDDRKDQKILRLANKLKKIYPYLYYKQNKPPLKHDKNLVRSLRLPNTKYVWILGDSLILEKNALEKIILFLSNNKPKLLGVNAVGRKLNYKSAIINKPDEVILNLGWHLTLTGATIYSSDAIRYLKKIDYKKIKNFPQFFLIFTYLKTAEKFYWINDQFISPNQKRKDSYWIKDTFSVFIHDWAHVIDSLNSYYARKVLNRVRLSHAKNTNLFSLRNLIKLRMMGYFGSEDYEKYKDTLDIQSKIPIKIIKIISLVPRGFLSLFRV
tara:strand:+ start:54 stop:1769 length:1716 start_codon:yes stop_codon:yes gene_type:complete